MSNDSKEFDLSVVLLHGEMVDKQGDQVTTSLTFIDIHDLARTAKTYGLRSLFIAHPASTLRNVAKMLCQHWESGFGADYNPDRKDALELVKVVSDLDEAICMIDLRTGKLPKLIATSAKAEAQESVRTLRSFSELREDLLSEQPYLLMLGTGWGMAPDLLARADLLLPPIEGVQDYNHLSVRSACAIMLDRLLGERTAIALQSEG